MQSRQLTVRDEKQREREIAREELVVGNIHDIKMELPTTLTSPWQCSRGARIQRTAV